MIRNNGALCNYCEYRESCISKEVLAGINADSSNIVTNLSDQINLDENQILYSQGDKFKSIFSIKSGCIKTYSIDEDGNELIEGIFYPGEFLSLDCISFNRYSHFAVAKERSQICIFNYDELEHISSKHPKVALQISKSISSQLSKQLRWQQIMSKGNVEQRLVAWVLFISSKLGMTEDYYEFDIPISNTDISNILQMRPESLSRAVKKLNMKGNIYIKNKKCTVINKTLLFLELPDLIKS